MVLLKIIVVSFLYSDTFLYSNLVRFLNFVKNHDSTFIAMFLKGSLVPRLLPWYAGPSVERLPPLTAGGMRTYDYILAMREESQSIHHFDDFDISSQDRDYDDSPEKPRFFSRFIS
ncbi:putative S-acyltransferase [Platanthera guangdongensis]|uniref:S-acyltransferase n=1 Tax=Platanthera guangdongensis TaxID=2320717 RepID=A0ABR2M8L2_9ASPA